MQFHVSPFPSYEPGKTNHKLANNGRSFSIFSIVTRVRIVIPSRLGSICSNGNTTQMLYIALGAYYSMGTGGKKPKFETENQNQSSTK